MKDFFISYSTADRSWAEWIAWNLEEAGYSTVIQAWDIRPGSNFALDIRKATRETERIIAVLSPDYLDSLYTQSEWVAAFKQDPTKKASCCQYVCANANRRDYWQQLSTLTLLEWKMSR